jgi:hypothetical protein
MYGWYVNWESGVGSNFFNTECTEKLKKEFHREKDDDTGNKKQIWDYRKFTGA